MTRERNKVVVFSSWYDLLANFSAGAGRSREVYDKIKAGAEKMPIHSGAGPITNSCGFVIFRESILINRGSKADASWESRVSSVGYVGMSNILKNNIDDMSLIFKRGGVDLNLLWIKVQGWKKEEMYCRAILYKDSKLSGIIARRAIDQLHFRDASLADDAKWRSQNNAPANPTLVSGSSEEYEELPTQFASGQRRAACISF